MSRIFQDKTILFTCAGFGGGIGKMMRFISSICVNKFRDVYLMHRGAEGSNDIPPLGVQEIIIPASDCSNALIWRYKQIRYIRNVIRRINPDIICCLGTEQSFMIAVSMYGINNIKVIQCERGDPFALNSIWRILTKWAFHKANYCVFQLQKQGEWYGKSIMDKSVVIPNPYIPTGNIDPYVGVRTKTIVSVGRFVAEKRYEVLIDAFKKVHEKHPEYKLVIYGDGPLREKYQKVIEIYNLGCDVSMPGYINNPMEAIKDAGIFVLSSLHEGFPNTLIEALALGLPTVSTDCTPGGPDFLTDHGRRGLIVPVEDSQAMSDALCRIIEDPNTLAELENNSIEIISVLDKERISNMWLDFFENIVKTNA